MSALSVLAVALAGGIGSALRYLADNAVPAKLRARFPWGTALVNLTGSLLLGMLVGLASVGLSGFWAEVLGIGLLGGYTTFSKSSVETVRLALERRVTAAVLYGFGVLAACILLGFLGYFSVVLHRGA